MKKQIQIAAETCYSIKKSTQCGNINYLEANAYIEDKDDKYENYVIEFDTYGKAVVKSPYEIIYTLADKFCLNEDKECFYTISDNGETVTALAEWNLLVGSTIVYDDWEEWNEISVTDISTSETNYGIQDSSALGIDYINGSLISKGVIEFSETNYWKSTKIKPKVKYGTSYPAWVYDENSSLWDYVQDYQNYIRSDLGKKSVTATLLSYEQAVDIFDCDIITHSCDSEILWVYQTSYWLGSARNGTTIYAMLSYIDGSDSFYSCIKNINSGLGIRPVITIDKSEIKKYLQS